MRRTTKAIIVMATSILLMISTKVNAQTLTINTETLFLREETSTASDIVELLSYGETYEIIGEEGQWYQIKTENYTGYVHKDYVIAEGGVDTEEPANTTVEEPQNEVVEENTVVNETTNETVSEPEPAEKPDQEPAEEFHIDTKMRVSQATKLRVLPLVHAIVLEDLTVDTELTIITTCGKWAYVETQTQTGWVRVDMLAKLDNENNISHYPTEEKPEENEPQEQAPTEEPDEEMNKPGYVAGTGVNVRSMASTEGDAIEVLNTNAEVTVIGQEGDWYKIRYGDIEGYILARFVSDTKVEVTSRGESVQREPVVEVETPEPEMTTTSTPVASSKGEEIVAYAKQYLGKPYVYGGSGPNSFDCSGFTMYVYQHFGISMSHSANAQSRLGTSVSKENLQPGDLVFFRDYETGVGIGHVGIYIGGGDFIHASSGSGYCVKISTLLSGSYDNRYMSAKRLI